MLVREETTLGAEVTREDLSGVEGALLDCSEVRVRLDAWVAIDPIVGTVSSIKVRPRGRRI